MLYLKVTGTLVVECGVGDGAEQSEIMRAG